MNKKRILTLVIVILLVRVCLLFFLKVGKKTVNKSFYELELDADYANSLMWTYTFSKDNIIEVRDSEYIEKDNGKGVQHYEFIGINKGSVVVTFKYQKDGSNEVLDTKKITLVVDKNLNIKKK